MIRFLTDEDFDGRIVRGLQRRAHNVDLVRCQDVGLRTLHDRRLLEFAAKKDLVLLTHDIRTMSAFAAERIANAQKMPGVILVPQEIPIRQVIDEIEMIALCAEPEDLVDQIKRIPL